MKIQFLKQGINEPTANLKLQIKSAIDDQVRSHLVCLNKDILRLLINGIIF
jgi:hypothetical protein